MPCVALLALLAFLAAPISAFAQQASVRILLVEVKSAAKETGHDQ